MNSKNLGTKLEFEKDILKIPVKGCHVAQSDAILILSLFSLSPFSVTLPAALSPASRLQRLPPSSSLPLTPYFPFLVLLSPSCTHSLDSFLSLTSTQSCPSRYRAVPTTHWLHVLVLWTQKVSMTSFPAWQWLMCNYGSACNMCGRATHSKYCVAVIRPPYRPISVPKFSANSLHQNGNLHSQWKCPDYWYIFLCKKNKLCQWIWAKQSLIWGNDLEFILVATSAFQRYITCLCLKLFAKKSHFPRQTVKLKVKTLPRFVRRANWVSKSGF